MIVTNEGDFQRTRRALSHGAGIAWPSHASWLDFRTNGLRCAKQTSKSETRADTAMGLVKDVGKKEQ